MKGLELSEKYFKEIYFPKIKEISPEIVSKISAGLVGEGSECYGYDDMISRDHDFIASCCVWLEHDDYIKYADKLNEELSKLPNTYEGFSTNNIGEMVKDRRGIIDISEFMYKYLGVEHIPSTIQEWRNIPEHSLFLITSGKVFMDNTGNITKIREALKYYPDIIRENKIATRCMKIAQSGQYNLGRSYRRQDLVAARLAETIFIEEVMHMVYLLNKKYTPYYKWMYRGLQELPILGKEISLLLRKIVEDKTISYIKILEIVEDIAVLLVDELKNQGLINNISDYYLANYGEYIQRNIEDPFLSSWTAWED